MCSKLCSSLSLCNASPPCAQESGAAPPLSNAPELWSGVGCPERFSASEEYGAGDTVSVCNDSYCSVYECQHDLPAPGKFCSTPGYEPGSLHSGAAWLLRGSCSGSMAPTVASEELWSNIGCPPKFSADAEYGGGDIVSVCNDVGYCTVYQCQNDLPAPGKFCDTPGKLVRCADAPSYDNDSHLIIINHPQGTNPEVSTRERRGTSSLARALCQSPALPPRRLPRPQSPLHPLRRRPVDHPVALPVQGLVHPPRRVQVGRRRLDRHLVPADHLATGPRPGRASR